jgi:hypothetical protein
MKTLDDLTTDDLRELYLERRLTETQIAELYNTTQFTINRRRHAWGIETLGKTGRMTASLPTLTELQEALLYGSLLGDGNMTTTGPEAARFFEGHSLAQEGYLNWKAEILGTYVRQIVPTKKTDKRSGKVHHGKALSTFSTTHLRPWFNKFYPAPEHKRIFPADLPQRLTPFILAVWYMDDGSVMKEFHPRITFGLDDVSLERALAALRVLGFEPTVHRGETKESDRTITFPGQDRKFYDMIQPHVPECMAYKIPEFSLRRVKDENAKKLTIELAQQLSAGGVSAAEIGRRYGVGASTVKRRIAGEERKPMGRPPKSKEE